MSPVSWDLRRQSRGAEAVPGTGEVGCSGPRAGAVSQVTGVGETKGLEHHVPGPGEQVGRWDSGKGSGWVENPSMGIQMPRPPEGEA